jgi:sulfoxide reductase heme-binding subunit YedZ
MKAGKHDFEQPLIFGAIVATMLIMRLVWRLKAQVKKHSALVLTAR